MVSGLRLPHGIVLGHDEKRIVFVGAVDDFVLRFVVEGTNDEYLVESGDGVRVRPTVKWVYEEFARNRIQVFGTSEATQAGWRGRFLGLDRAACLNRPRAVLKYDLAVAAINRRLPRNASVLKAFADELLPAELLRPSGRSIIRAMNNLQLYDQRIGAMCNRSGREKGRSQLPSIADLIVQQSVALFWSNTALKKMDAHALATVVWRQRKDMGIDGLGEKPPSKTTVMNRINACESKETSTSKWGRHDADKYFLASGESAAVSSPFELVYIDGLETEQVSLFMKEIPIPSSKLKVIQALDAFSLFAFPTTPFAGPYRSEMAMGALLGVIEPPVLDEETLTAHPEYAQIFGRIGRLRLDNDKAIIPPSAIGNLASIITRVELSRKFGPDEKSPVENFIGWVKRRLDGEPGTVLSPRSRKRSIRRDPLAEATLTRADYARKYEGLRLEWNSMGHKALGGRTPNAIMLEHIEEKNIRMVNPGEIRRHLARTASGILTTDGIVFEGITYRWNRTGVTKLLSENLAAQHFSKRLDGTARCGVSIRIYDWNLDFIEVLNEATNHFTTLWSIDPEYTEFLSRFEHKFHRENEIIGATGAQTNEERALNRGKTLRRELGKLEQGSYGVAKKAAAVLETAEVRSRARNIENHPDLTAFSDFITMTDAAGNDRHDIPTGPSQSRVKRGQAGRQATGTPHTDGPSQAELGGLDPRPRSNLQMLEIDAEEDLDGGIDWDDDTDGQEGQK